MTDKQRMDWLEEKLFIHGMPSQYSIYWEDDGLHFDFGDVPILVTNIRTAIDSAMKLEPLGED